MKYTLEDGDNDGTTFHSQYNKKESYSNEAFTHETEFRDGGVTDANGKGQRSLEEVVAKQRRRKSSKKHKKKKKKKKGGKKKKEEKLKLEQVSFGQLFRYANCYDVILMVTGTLGAMVHGAAFPYMMTVFGQMIDTFINYSVCTQATNFTCTQEEIDNYYNTTGIDPTNETNPLEPIDVEYELTIFSYYYVGIACAVVVCGYFQVGNWVLASTRQTRKIRELFFRSIMRQEIGWFDVHHMGELNTRMNDDVNKISDAIADKFSVFIQRITTFIGGIIVGFINGWQLTLVIMAISPLLGGGAALMGRFVANMTSKELKAYAAAGAVAEEVLSSIRTVAAFSGEKREVERYGETLLEAEKQGIRKGMTQGFFAGYMWCLIFLSYALSFWYGSSLVFDESNGFSAGNLMTVFFAVLVGAINLGQAAPNLEAFSVGRAAAALVFDIIERKSKIDPFSESGHVPDKVVGDIEFHDVDFSYPSRDDQKIINNMSLVFKAGETTAVVGPSGMGKSTVLQLVQRFYDPDKGLVTLDGHDLRTLNTMWLRKMIGIVQQEPSLFATSIAENIRFGREGVTDEEVEKAARAANAYNFIMDLPDKFETNVGTGGGHLSGGQKQRIAIARALVRNPKILLLDQACSALDMTSEAMVLQELDKVRHGRTTVIVAHRLSTIRDADVIIGIEHGKAVERGSHDQLMDNNGVYFTLVTLQTTKTKKIGNGEITGDASDSDNSDSEEKNPLPIDQGPEGPLEKVTDITHGHRRSLRRSLRKRNVSQLEGPDDMAAMGITTPNPPQKYSRKPKKDYDSDSSSDDSDSSSDEEEEIEPASLGRIMKLNVTEWPYILGGTIGSAVNGAIQPVFAILFSGLLGVFALPTVEQQQRGVNAYSIIFVGIAILSFVCYFLQNYMFAKSGEILTRRLRKMGFECMLRQDIGWYDDNRNNPGALSARLATDAAMVKGATGGQIGIIVSAIASIGSALIIAFYFGWKLALVVVAFLPMIVMSGLIQARLLTGSARRDKDSLEEASKVVSEAIENIRTVASLNKEEYFTLEYNSVLAKPYSEGKYNSRVYGVTFGIANCIIFFAYAASFRFGGYLVARGEMEFQYVFRVFSAIVFGGTALGRASNYAPDYAKAKTSAARIFKLFDREPPIDSYSTEGDKWSDFKGEIVFKDCLFTYPTRPDITVLRGLNVSIGAGETLALVGQSGCGKSTSVQLLERFYDPDGGVVLVDGHDTSKTNVGFLRGKIGIVSQEPVLFGGSVRDNIVYGDQSRVVPQADVERAAKLANMHEFILALRDGYETSVGDKGDQLSRGQKQRVAIARALVRSPKILLLDEATSALDTESEQIVQEALDRAREGRTCVVIAHRLSTIRNANKIAVISQGQVIEQGTHDELMDLEGAYYKLITTNASLS